MADIIIIDPDPAQVAYKKVIAELADIKAALEALTAKLSK